MDSLDLSRRAVAAGWKWQAGALAINAGGPVRIDGCDSFNEPFVWGKCQWSGERVELWVREMPLPDFSDAATRGALLEQVRRRWEDPAICTDCDGLHWSVVRVDGTVLAYGDSETAALVAALEAAPKEKADV